MAPGVGVPFGFVHVAEPVHFYSAPWEVVEGDVAGCGPRLFLTGTKLLNGVWDRLLGEARQAGFSSAEQLDSVSWLVLEHGVRVLAPVSLRERLVCLLSLDELADTSTLRLYYRVMRSNGEPIACAFMALSCTQKATGTTITLPQPLADLLASRGGFREREQSPSFIERALVLPGAEESLFPDDVRALAVGVAMQSAGAMTQRRTPATPLSIPALGELPMPEGRTAFFFPDAPSYDGRLLCELRAYLPYLADYFDEAEEVSRRVFRQSFLPLVDMDAIALHDQRLERCPELAHVGVVLTGVLIAESLREHGVRADAVIGDGLGELAALAVAGAADLSTALRLAAQRALASRPSNGDGEASAAEQFKVSLEEVRFASPRLPVVTLRPRGLFADRAEDRFGSLGSAKGDADLIAAAWGAGCEHVIECGPRGFLSTGVRAPAPMLSFTPDVRPDVRA
jgi:acyl-CoA thioesterase FadM